MPKRGHSRDGNAVKEKKILSMALSCLLICCIVPALTSCSERQSEDKVEKLSQLEFAIVLVTAKAKADRADLNQAVATGASAETIAKLREKVIEDENILKSYVYSIYTIEYDGFADFPRYPVNNFALPR